MGYLQYIQIVVCFIPTFMDIRSSGVYWGVYSMVSLTCIIVVYTPNCIIYICVASGPDTQKTCIHLGWMAISLEDSKVITHWK
jgi:hypothetical protein